MSNQWFDEQQELYEEYLKRNKNARRILFWYRVKRALRMVLALVLVIVILFLMFSKLYEDGSFIIFGLKGCIPFMLCGG